jgi:hypothetical protein
MIVYTAEAPTARGIKEDSVLISAAGILQKWMDQLKWQRLRPFEKLADMLLKHLEGILNYCRTKVPMGVSRP